MRIDGKAQLKFWAISIRTAGFVIHKDKRKTDLWFGYTRMMYHSKVLIIQISPMRMGSTWQFNAARELLMLGEYPLISSMLDMEDGLDVFEQGNKNVLLKSHFFEMNKMVLLSKGLDVRFLISCRNLFDTMESSSRVFPSQPVNVTLTNIENTLSLIRTIQELQFPTHITYIDSLNTHDELLAETKQIARFLDLEVSSSLISETASRLSKESVSKFIANELDFEGDFNQWDKQTLWHGSHVSTSAKSQAVKQGLGFLPYQSMDISEKMEEFPLDRLNFQVQRILELFFPLAQQRDEIAQQRDEIAQQRDEIAQQRDVAMAERDVAMAERDEITQQRNVAMAARDQITNSTIWKLTNPLRRAVNFFKR